MWLTALRERLDHNTGKGLHRERTVTTAEVINFCSNDYLGVSHHPVVLKAFSKAARQYGLGSGSSALITGYHPAHQELEERFADFFQRDKAILFNSGYHANIGVITALANRNSHIYADRFCHASIIDAILLSRAHYARYEHNNPADLSKRLNNDHVVDGHTLIISESVFSMEGDIAPVAELVEIAKKYQSIFMIDDAHGAGVLGCHGRGICEYAHLSQAQVPVLVAPLGKAFGSLGAIVAGSKDLIDALLQFSRTYRYSTALPPAIAHATSQALKIVTEESWRRERLNQLIAFFIREADKRNLALISRQNTPIQGILIGDNQWVMELKAKLLDQGIAVAAIRPPTVPAQTARLRISLSCLHTEAQIIQLLDLLRENGIHDPRRKN